MVDAALPPGRAVNAAICAAAATATAVPGLLGPDAIDADGVTHPGLPWACCTILAAAGDQLPTIRAKASASEAVFVADMPSYAQHTRVYDDLLSRIASSSSTDMAYYAVSLIGPRNRIDKIVGKLPLLP